MTTSKPIGPDYGVTYTLVGPDGTEAVFNDSTSGSYVGMLTTNSSGLDSAEVREDAWERVEADGGVHGKFYYGRRSIVLNGQINPTSGEDRNKKVARLQQASNAMTGDAKLVWTASGGEKVYVNVRRQQPLRISAVGGLVKEFQLQLVCADSRIQAYNETTATATGTEISAGVGGIEVAPTTISSVAPGTTAWTNPENAKTANAVYATANFLKTDLGKTTQHMKTSGGTFSIPSTAVIPLAGAVIKGKTKNSSSLIDDQELYFSFSGLQVGENAVEGPTAHEFNGTNTAKTMIMYERGGFNSSLNLTPANFNSGTPVLLYQVKHLYIEEIEEQIEIDQLNFYVQYYNALQVTNEGNGNADAVITINGPGATTSTLEVWNVTQNKKLVIEGTSELIRTGDAIRINTERRTIERKARNNNKWEDIYSLLNFEKSEWFSLSPGANVVYASLEASGTPTITVAWRNAWI